MRSFFKSLQIAVCLLALLAVLPTTEIVAAEPPQALGGPVVLLATGDIPVNVRSGPGTQYAVIGSLGPGVPAPIVGQDAGRKWWLIRLNYDGWVNIKVAPVTGDVSGVPVVTDTAMISIATHAPKPMFLVMTATPAPQQMQTPPEARACCKICTTGKACGDTCISRRYTCHKGPGCACDG
jgi:hypothetical protein